MLIFLFLWDKYDQYYSLRKLLLGVVGVITWLALSVIVEIPNRRQIEQYSMGIYLFHLPVIYVLLEIIPLDTVNSVIVVFVLFVLGFISSIILQIVFTKFKAEKLIGL